MIKRRKAKETKQNMLKEKKEGEEVLEGAKKEGQKPQPAKRRLAVSVSVGPLSESKKSESRSSSERKWELAEKSD